MTAGLGDDDGPDMPHRAEGPKARLLRRRWRLWWRYQILMLPQRRLLRSLRIIRSPADHDLVAAGLQLVLARWLGLGYTALVSLRERLRIQRVRAPERVEPGRVFLTLIGLQRGLLVWLVLLVAVGAVVDAYLPPLVDNAATALHIKNWLSSHIALPPETTLQLVLTVVAGATGTILGIVLSITLIVFQTTAERYKSGRLVAFLLRERVTSAVIRLLALGFAYSVCVLLIVQTATHGQRPYFSTLVGLILGVGPVLSLITYRSHALLGYLPASIGRALVADIAQKIGWATNHSAGQSAHNHAHEVVAEDLRTLVDLVDRLKADMDIQGLVEVIAALQGLVEFYMRAKRHIGQTSRWWSQRAVRADSAWTGLNETLAAEGLPDPTFPEPDRIWLEREMIGLIRKASGLANSEVDQAIATWLMRLLQLAYYSQEVDSCRALFQELDRFASSLTPTAPPALVEQIAQVPWLLFEMIAKGPGFDAERVVQAAPWKHDIERLGLPWLEAQEAGRLSVRIRRETAIVGRILTPAHAMVRETAREAEPKLTELRTFLREKAGTWLAQDLKRAIDQKSLAVGLVAKQMIRSILRANHLDVDIPMPDDFTKLLVAAYSMEPDPTLRSDLRDTSALLARELAERQSWRLCWTAVRAACTLGALAETAEPDVQRRISLMFDTLLTLAHVHAWAEFYGEPDHVWELGRYLDRPWRNLDGLVHMVEGERFSTTLTLSFMSGVRYHQWFQSLLLAAHRLPDAYERVGQAGVMIERGKEHPSSLFSHWLMFYGYDECLQHLVSATREARDGARRQLATTLMNFARAKGGIT